MGELTLRATGPRPADEVWERYADPQRWSSWSPQIRRVDAVGRIRPGLTGRVASWVPGLQLGFRVLEVDARRRTWSWSVRSGPLDLVLEHGVAGAGNGRSSTWLRLRGPSLVLLAYAPLARMALRRLVH
jgi:hypothetical protein